MVEKRSGTKYIPFMEPEDEDRIVVSMLEYKDRIYVATQKGVYILDNDKLRRLEIVEKTE